MVTLKTITILCLFSIAFLFVFTIFIYNHEDAHQKIFSYYGINSHTKFFPEIFTIANNGENISKCNDSCWQSHSINESIGYNAEVLLFMFYVSTIFIIVALDKGEQ